MKKCFEKNMQTKNPNADGGPSNRSSLLLVLLQTDPQAPFPVLHLHVIQSPIVFIMLQFHHFLYTSVTSTSH